MAMKLEKIERLLKAAVNKAEQMDIKITTAFVDEGGHLKALIRMDEACFGDIDFAINKAYTAAAWQTDSGNFYQDSLPTGDFFGIHFSNHQKVATFTGGMPIFESGELAGAVGVSGGTREQDQMCLDEIKKILVKENNGKHEYSGVC